MRSEISTCACAHGPVAAATSDRMARKGGFFTTIGLASAKKQLASVKKELASVKKELASMKKENA